LIKNKQPNFLNKQLHIETPIVEVAESYFDKLILLSKVHRFSLALWRYPHQTKFSAVLSFNESKKSTLDITQDIGFAVGHFLSEQRDAHFIPADIIVHETNTGVEVIGSNENKKKLEDLLRNAEAEYLTEETQKISSFIPKEGFIQNVADAVQQIKEGCFKKVVIARREEVLLTGEFSIIKTLYKMSEQYPLAFISYVSCPSLGHWIGATPEVLLSIREKRYFKTVSLAGTQLANSKGPKYAVWTQKEIEEQALVTRYIIDCLKKIRLREYEDVGPRTIQAGNLFHLCTDFFIDMKETNFAELGNVMLELLHPTSAVCGMPKPEALDFIKRYEAFDRALYSGFLGPVNIEGNTHLAVNLRCAKINHASATLFAGVGITADSEPEKEWQETQIKLQTMSKVLK